MALNKTQVLVGCCVSLVCVVQVHNVNDLRKLSCSGDNKSTIHLIRTNDEETFKWLDKFIASKEKFGEFTRVNINTAQILDQVSAEVVKNHEKLMKDRKSLTDFRVGDRVIMKSMPSEEEEFEIREIPSNAGYSPDQIKRLKYQGYVCIYCQRVSGWIPWAYTQPATDLWRVA